MAARVAFAWKLAARFSCRVATRRNCLAFDQNRAYTFRSRHQCGSVARCSLRFFCVGMCDACFEERGLIPAGHYHEVWLKGLEKDPVGQMSLIYAALGLPALQGVLKLVGWFG